MRALTISAALVWCLAMGGAALAAPITDDSFCQYQGLPSSLRQTLVVIDGAVVTPETTAPAQANSVWREFARRYVDALDPTATQLIDARERVTLAVANADGSGITVLFTGCVPLFRKEEAGLEGQTGVFAKFMGNDWRHSADSAGEKFRREATLAMIQGLKGVPVGKGAATSFAGSALISAIGKSMPYSLDDGIPRVVIFTDLNLYQFPTADIPTVRRTGRTDAERVGLNMLRAEVHVFGVHGTDDGSVGNYLQAFFLAGRARLGTLTSITGSLNPSSPPRSVSVFQGTIGFPDAEYPMRMRLAVDGNGTVVDSWVEIQSVESKFVPFSGILTCSASDACQFTGDNVFAQIWSDNPDPNPEFDAWIPFGGMRNFSFELTKDSIGGLVKDEVGFVVGREGGLEFHLKRIANARF
jgi:hypothetical protein